jgi:putative transposase
MGINEVVIAPQNPWQSPYVERFIGSIGRELLEHMVVLHATHFMRLLTESIGYYCC